MEKNALIARLAIEAVAAQIAAGAKHPSPALIKEAVDTAAAVIDEVEKCVEARELAAEAAQKAEAQAKSDAAAKAALDAKVAAEVAAAASKANAAKAAAAAKS
jgi:hypothetical protein